eukprot:4292847-Prymnesium_polylepis.1
MDIQRWTDQICHSGKHRWADVFVGKEPKSDGPILDLHRLDEVVEISGSERSPARAQERSRGALTSTPLCSQRQRALEINALEVLAKFLRH